MNNVGAVPAHQEFADSATRNLIFQSTKMASADVNISPPMEGEGAVSAGEFVLKKLFAEFVVLSERKLRHIVSQPLVR